MEEEKTISVYGIYSTEYERAVDTFIIGLQEERRMFIKALSDNPTFQYHVIAMAEKRINKSIKKIKNKLQNISI